MARTGSTTVDDVYKLQVAVGEAVEELRQSGDARRVATAEKDLAAAVVAVRERGNVAPRRGLVSGTVKAVLKARSANMRVAEKIYQSLQREALGIADGDR